MHVVETNAVVLRQAIAVSPAPTSGDAGVIQVRNVVMSYGVIAALSDPNANRFRVNPSAMMDDVVVDGDVMRAFVQVLANLTFADPYATGSQI